MNLKKKLNSASKLTKTRNRALKVAFGNADHQGLILTLFPRKQKVTGPHIFDYRLIFDVDSDGLVQIPKFRLLRFHRNKVWIGPKCANLRLKSGLLGWYFYQKSTLKDIIFMICLMAINKICNVYFMQQLCSIIHATLFWYDKVKSVI